MLVTGGMGIAAGAAAVAVLSVLSVVVIWSLSSLMVNFPSGRGKRGRPPGSQTKRPLLDLEAQGPSDGTCTRPGLQCILCNTPSS